MQAMIDLTGGVQAASQSAHFSLAGALRCPQGGSAGAGFACPSRGHPGHHQSERRREAACSATTRRRRRIHDGEDGDEPGELQRRRAAVIEYVRDVQPHEVQAFLEDAPPMVVQAMKQTVSNMVGTLPPPHFSVSINTVAESLASLMQTMLRTGYLLRSVQYQLELELALQGAAATMMHHPPAAAAAAAAAVGDVPASPSSSSASATSILLTPPTPALAADGLLPASTSTSFNPPSSSNTKAVIPDIVLTTTTTTSNSDANAATATAASNSSGSSISGNVALEVRGWAQPEHEYAPGVQLSRVDGEVLRWHPQHGLERMAATSYIRMLEQRVAELQQQVAQAQQLQQQQQQAQAQQGGFQPFPPLFASSSTVAVGGGAAAAASVLSGALGGGGGGGGAVGFEGNPVLSYLRSLDPTSVAALGACGPDVSDAMTAFVARLLGTTEQEQLRQMTSEFSAVELSKLLFWLLVVGWSLRAMEVRLEVEEGFGSA